jgi:hypothetical protein
MNDWTDTGSYAYNKLQSKNEDLKRLVESQCYDLDAMSAIKEERDQLREQNTMLDAEAAKDEALLRQALEALVQARSFSEGGTQKAQIAIAALRERLK